MTFLLIILGIISIELALVFSSELFAALTAAALLPLV
jgi:hypothetical protein